MLAGTHRIRRQRWQVSAASPAGALALRKSLHDQLDTVLASAFQRAFDALHTGADVLHIPRLALRVQLAQGEDFVAALAMQIEQQLAQILPQVKAKDPARVTARQITPKASRRQILLEYLSHGRVAWYAATMEMSELLPLLHDAARSFVAEPQQVLRSLGATLEARIAASFRLLQLLDAAARVSLLQPLVDTGNESDRPLRTALLRVGALPRLSSYLQLRLMALLLALRGEDLRQPLSPEVSELLRELATQVQLAGSAAFEFDRVLTSLRVLGARSDRTQFDADAMDTGAVIHKDSALPADGSESVLVADQESSIDVSIAKNLSGGAPMVDGSRPALPANPLTATEFEAQAVMISDDSLLTVHDNPVGEQLMAAAAGHRTSHAGLVLLHPFVPRLFEATGIVNPGGRLAAIRLPRAAALLHWLATGRTMVLELELTLIKVLLGLAPEDPLPVAAGLLSDEDCAEADTLLAATLEHWTALGKTSIAGLRTSFLQRRGLLRDGERGWHLNVESESFDVLLGQLPWAVSIVKLPWMTKPIFVDWPTP